MITVTYKTVDMFLTCGVFDEYLHIEKSYSNEIKCVGKGCFSAFKKGINHATIMSFDRDTDQSLKGMHVNSFVAGTLQYILVLCMPSFGLQHSFNPSRHRLNQIPTLLLPNIIPLLLHPGP